MTGSLLKLSRLFSISKGPHDMLTLDRSNMHDIKVAGCIETDEFFALN